MFPMIVQFLRVYMPYIALPFAAVIGFVGFNMESKIRGVERLSSANSTPKKTFNQLRLERRLGEGAEELPDSEDALRSSNLEYRGDLMFDKNK